MKKKITGLAGLTIMSLILVGAATWWYSDKISIEERRGATGVDALHATNIVQTTSPDAIKPTASATQSTPPAPKWVFPLTSKSGTQVVDIIPGMQIVDYKQPQAEVRADNTLYRLTPNDNGYFGQVDVQANQKLAVKVYLPDGESGQNYIVQVEDGGALLGQKFPSAQVAQLNDAQQLSFNYQVSDQPGIYRVILRSGGNCRYSIFGLGRNCPWQQPANLILKFITENGMKLQLKTWFAVVVLPCINGTAFLQAQICGNNNYGGTSGKGAPQSQAGDPFQVYTGNDMREVDDICRSGAAWVSIN
jgi:hypothetical protein